MLLLLIYQLWYFKEAIYIFVVCNNKYISIAWQSKCIRRVFKRSLAAKTLTMVDMSEDLAIFRKLLLELL